jgi:gliding motility-associated-like protein
MTANNKVNDQENAVQPEVNTTDAQTVNSTLGATNSASEKAITQNIPDKTSSPVKNEVINNSTTENKVQNTQPEIQPNVSSPTPPSSSLNATFHANQTVICSGTAVQFIADVTEPCTYRWDFGDRTTSGEKSPSHTYKTPGNYPVKLKITSAKDKSVSEQSNTITVRQTPTVDIDFSTSDDNPSAINFEAKSTNATEWSWNFDDGKNSSEQNPVHTYTKKGTYQVNVTVKNTFGCSASDKRSVTIEQEFPFAPTSFSPNGDGDNDVWFPVGLHQDGYSFTLKIFNRSSDMIYEMKDKNDSWDGQNTKPGEMYMWKATVKDKNGKTTNYEGTITVKD